MKKFKVFAEVIVKCSREVKAIDEDDALNQCKDISANEWIESFTIEREEVDIYYPEEINEKRS